jgi:hypothetical protein
MAELSRLSVNVHRSIRIRIASPDDTEAIVLFMARQTLELKKQSGALEVDNWAADQRSLQELIQRYWSAIRAIMSDPDEGDMDGVVLKMVRGNEIIGVGEWVRVSYTPFCFIFYFVVLFYLSSTTQSGGIDTLHSRSTYARK